MDTKTTNPVGRPVKIVDEHLILDLASKGLIMSELAAHCGVSESTLHRRYAEVIKRGKSLMHASLRKKQFELAMDGNATMLIWLGKQELDQADKSEFKGSLKHDVSDLSRLSDEELAQVESIIETAHTRSDQG